MIKELTEVQRAPLADTYSVQQLVVSADDDIEVALEEPVCFLNIKCSLDVEQISKQLSFTKVGNRETAYFGSSPYQYGEIVHEPAPYPQNCEFFDQIFRKLSIKDSEFSPEKYTCLVTR